MRLRDLIKTNLPNNGLRSLFESILIPEVVKAFSDWKNSTRNLEYVLIGGIALSYYTKPRTTAGVDVLFLKTSDIPEIINKFKKHRTGVFQHNDTHIEIEVLTPSSINMSEDLALTIYKNAKIIDEIRIASPSGLVASKLGRFKLQDQADVEALLEIEEIDLTPYPLPKEWKDNYEKLLQILGRQT
jgi:hypothetical protein